MTDIKKIFGDVNFKKRIQYTNGGTLSGGNSLISKNISNITQNEIKNRMIDYNSFKKKYYKNNKLDEKYIMLLESLLYDITPICSDIFEKEKPTSDKIKKIYNLSNEELFSLFITYFKINNIKNSSYEILFFSYRDLLEKLLSIFIKLRNSICCDNNMKKLETHWNTYNETNRIDTSSIYLYFIFNKIDSLPKYKWIIDNKKYKKINNTIRLFLDKLDDVNYNYTGFCPYDVKNRISSIFSFPIKELIDCIIVMDNKNLYKNIYKEIFELVNYIEINKVYIKNKLNTNRIVKNYNIDKIKLINNNNINNKSIIETYTNFIKYIFDAYVKFTPYLLRVENKFYKMYTTIEKISKKIRII